MIRPGTDRLDYSKKLEPPVGYETVFAVGTTYSLDLDALIGISIALGLSESIDGELAENPIYLLEALRKTVDKVLIFCEGGQIKVPKGTNSLYALLEKMVFEVNLRNKKSFHPKFWLVKYQNKKTGDALYRLLVLSRNLTFDRSWDFAVTMDGKDGEVIQSKNEPVKDFLNYLSKHLKASSPEIRYKGKLLKNLAVDVDYVEFAIDKKFYDYNFYPVGIDGYGIEETGLFNSYNWLFVITPFLSKGIIDELNKKSLSYKDKTLVTRRSELSKLDSSIVDDMAIYVMKDIIIDGEEAISEEAVSEEVDKDLEERTQKQDIHAKIYLKTKYNDTDFYIGSLNATQSACYGNVELMLNLKAKRRHLSADMLKKELFGENEKENPFEKIEAINPKEEEKEPGENLEKSLKDLCRVKSLAKVTETDGKYSIEITFNDLPAGISGTISPLLSKKEEELSPTMRFEGLALTQLCEFYQITLVEGEEKLRRVIKVETEGIPDGRDGAIVNGIVKDKEGFIQYITFMLGDDYLLSFLENKSFVSNGFIFGKGEVVPAIYERMLKTAAHSPERLEEIQKLMDLISDDGIIPEGFKKLYGTFKRAVKR